MKGNVKNLILLSLLGVIVLPAIVYGQLPTEVPESCTIRANTGISGCPGVGSTAEYSNTYGTVSGALCCVFSSINLVINWIFIGLLLISVLVGLVGAYSIVTAGGNAEKVDAGKKWILYAIIGLGVAFLVRAIPFVVRTIVVGQ